MSRFLVAAAAAVAAVTGSVGAAQRTQTARPFDHTRHESVSCRSCHGIGRQHRAVLIRGPRDCAACHHDSSRRAECSKCHSNDQLDRVTTAVAQVSLTVWNAARTRALPFAHDTHEPIACSECHATAVTLERSRECGSCHQNHHRAQADCSACHSRPAATAHPATAHLTCGAVQCHAAPVAPEPTLSRNLCLVCHIDRRAHEPGAVCAGCHRIPDKETAAAILKSGAP